MSDYLPQDVLIDILSRLPVKSLLRFRCVCKSWNSLTKSPNFINTHLNQSNKNPNLLIKHFNADTKREIYSLRSDTQTLDELVEFDCPFQTRNKSFFRLVGSCNGLICLSDDHFGYTYTIIIWNPSIRKFFNLPSPRVCFDDYGPYMFALGFGFDPKIDDYKVVRLVYLNHKVGSWDNNGDLESLLFRPDDGYIAPPEVEVFSLSTGCWKTIDSGVPRCNMIEHFWSSAFLNGTIHWLAFYRIKDSNSSCNYRNIIMLFDVGSEVFREVNLPKRLAREYPLNLSIGVFGDKTISVFQYDERPTTNRCSVWVMRKYGVAESWNLQFNVNFGGIGIGIDQIILSSALGFRKNGELLLAILFGEVALFDPRNKTIKGIGIRGGRDSIFVGAYAESLVLLDKVNGIDEVEFRDTVDSEEVEERAISGANEQAVLLSLEKFALMHFLFARNSLS